MGSAMGAWVLSSACLLGCLPATACQTLYGFCLASYMPAWVPWMPRFIYGFSCYIWIGTTWVLYMPYTSITTCCYMGCHIQVSNTMVPMGSPGLYICHICLMVMGALLNIYLGSPSASFCLLLCACCVLWILPGSAFFLLGGVRWIIMLPAALPARFSGMDCLPAANNRFSCWFHSVYSCCSYI